MTSAMSKQCFCIQTVAKDSTELVLGDDYLYGAGDGEDSESCFSEAENG